MSDEDWNTLYNEIKADAARASRSVAQVDKRLITIDETSGVPLWMQLRNRLVYLITSGAFPAGAQLPSVRELALDLNLNYNTVNKVFRDIERDGYTITRRGKGTYVAEISTQEGDNSVAAAEMLATRYFHDCGELGISQQEAAALVARMAGGMFV